MRRRPVLALILAGALLAVCARPGRADGSVKVRGPIRGDVKWSGSVLVVGDVTVEEGARLTIAEGTDIVISRNATGSGGDNPNLVEIHVKGEILAAGSAHRPIRFRFEKEPKGATERKRRLPYFWMGLVIHPGARSQSYLRWCVFTRAFTGVQVGGDAFLLEDCVFHRCLMGVGTGVRWASEHDAVMRWETSTPRLVGCRFAHCYTAVTIEGGARPDLERCVVLSCTYGVANRRAGTTMAPRGIGAFIDRCTFAYDNVAIQGPSRVVNSIFYQNGAALQSSNFQAHYGVTTDRVVRGHNLYFGNENLLLGDTDLGERPVFEDPRFAREPPRTPTVETLAQDLRSLVGLAPGSPAVGRGTDGGDLGATGAKGSAKPWDIRAEVEGALVLGPFCALGPASSAPADLDEDDIRRLTRRLPSPGSLWDEAAWCYFREHAGDASARPEFFALATEGIWAAAACEGLVPGPMELRLGGDCRLQAWWNGELLPIPIGARRYDPDDLVFPVRVRKGENVLVVRLTPWTEERRFLARLVPPDATAGGTEEAGVAAPAATPPPEGDVSIRKALGRRPRRDREPAHVKLLLTDRVHWAGAEDEDRVAFLTADGEVLGADVVAMRYAPKRKALELDVAALAPERATRIRLTGLRDPAGHPLPPLEARIRWR